MDPAKVTVILGPPGTGKTTRLLGIVEEALARGVSPRQVAFISFTKKAAEEGKSRAMRKFSLQDEDLPHFRTLHSTAFRMLNMRRDQMLGWPHLRELGKVLGLEFKGKELSEDDVYGMNTADRLLFLEGLSRNKLIPLKRVWEEAFDSSIDWWELERFSKALALFKHDRGLLDFTDLLFKMAEMRLGQMPSLKLLMIDESQDLSALQWKCVDLLSEKAEKIYVCGDSLQCIFSWAGADVDHFIKLEGEVQVLDQSYRIPCAVHRLATSIAGRIVNKREAAWRPRKDEGAVNWHNDVDEVDLSKGTWLLLARNGYMLDQLEDHCLGNGYSFHSVNRDPLKSPALGAIKTWERLRRGEAASAEQVLVVAKFMTPREISVDLVKRLRAEEESEQHSLSDLKMQGLKTEEIWWRALPRISVKEREFFLAARRRGEALLKEPRIKISTIHSAKGAEAENVLLLTDMSFRCFENMQVLPDEEVRVWFVGCTRAKETLNIVSPKTNLYFEL